MITLAALALGVYGIDKHAGLQHDKMAVRAVSGLRDETNDRSFEAQPGGATPTCATAPVPTYGTSTQLLNGVESGGHCYYMMNPGETCDAACTRYGLGQCDEAALAAITVPSQCGINGASSGECRVLPSGNACETVLSQFGLTQVGTIPWMSHGYFNGQDASQIGNAGYAGCAYGDWGASDHRIQMAIYDQNSGGTSCSGTSGDSSRRFVCSCASGSGSGPSMSNHLDITTETRDGCISGKVPGRTALTSGASCSNSTSVASAGSAAAAATACNAAYEQKSRSTHRVGQQDPHAAHGTAAPTESYSASYDLVGELHLCEWRPELHRCEAGKVLTVCPEEEVVEVAAAVLPAAGFVDQGQGECVDSSQAVYNNRYSWSFTKAQCEEYANLQTMAVKAYSWNPSNTCCRVHYKDGNWVANADIGTPTPSGHGGESGDVQTGPSGIDGGCGGEVHCWRAAPGTTTTLYAPVSTLGYCSDYQGSDGSTSDYIEQLDHTGISDPGTASSPNPAYVTQCASICPATGAFYLHQFDSASGPVCSCCGSASPSITSNACCQVYERGR